MAAAPAYYHYRFDTVDLRDKVVLITGASQGIGAACAAAFRGQGARVAVTARSVEKLDRVAASECLAVPGDITDHAFRWQLVRDVMRQFGPVDVLVNNAGAGLYVPSTEARMEDARAIFELNVLSPLALTQLVMPGMRERKAGAIVNVGSIGGSIPLPWMSLYSASKFALEAWTDGLRMELDGTGIQVLKVSPGYVKTGFQDHAIGGGAPERLRRAKKFGVTPDEVAQSIVRGLARGSRDVAVPETGRLISMLYRIAPRLVEWQMMKMNR